MIYLIAIVGLILFLLITYLFLQQDPEITEKAEEFLAQGNYNAALQLLDPEKLKNAADPQLWYLRFRCFEELHEWDKALETLLEIRRLGKYPPALPLIELYRKIAYYTKLVQDEESAFEAYLNLLQIFPEDKEALREISIWAAQANQVNLALHFMEKAYKAQVDDGEFLKYFAVMLYEAGREESAFEIASKLLSLYPQDEEYAYLFTLMCQKSHFLEAKKYVVDLLSKTIDEQKKVWLARIYLNACLSQKTYGEATQFLEKFMAEHQLSEDYLVEFKYFALVLYLNEQNFQRASQLYDEISSLRSSYAHLNKIRYYIDYIDLHPPLENAMPFNELFQETFKEILPNDLVLRESKILKDINIDFGKYFEIKEGIVQLRDDYAIPTPEWAMNRFLNYSRDELPLFMRRIAEYLGYKIINQEAVTEPEALDFLASEKSSTNRILFSLRRYRDNAHLSDIFLANYRNRMHQLACLKGVLICNAEPTTAALESLKKNRDVEIVSGQKLFDLIIQYEKSKKKAITK